MARAPDLNLQGRSFNYFFIVSGIVVVGSILFLLFGLKTATIALFVVTLVVLCISFLVLRFQEKILEKIFRHCETSISDITQPASNTVKALLGNDYDAATENAELVTRRLLARIAWNNQQKFMITSVLVLLGTSTGLLGSVLLYKQNEILSEQQNFIEYERLLSKSRETQTINFSLIDLQRHFKPPRKLTSAVGSELTIDEKGGFSIQCNEDYKCIDIIRGWNLNTAGNRYSEIALQDSGNLSGIQQIALLDSLGVYLEKLSYDRYSRSPELRFPESTDIGSLIIAAKYDCREHTVDDRQLIENIQFVKNIVEQRVRGSGELLDVRGDKLQIHNDYQEMILTLARFFVYTNDNDDHDYEIFQTDYKASKLVELYVELIVSIHNDLIAYQSACEGQFRKLDQRFSEFLG